MYLYAEHVMVSVLELGGGAPSPGMETNFRGVMVKENAGGDLTTGQCCPSTLGRW